MTVAGGSPLTVEVLTSSPAVQRQREVLATIPDRFMLTSGQPAVVLASGRDVASHIDEITASGARAVVLIEAGRSTMAVLDRLDGLQRTGQATVVPAMRFAPRIAPAFTGQSIPVLAAQLADSTATTDDPTPGSLADGAVEQLAVLRLLVGPAQTVRLLNRSAYNVAFECRFAGTGQAPALVTCQASASRPARLQIHVVGATGRLEITADDSAPAQPAHIVQYAAEGARVWPPVFQSGHRDTWTSLHSMLIDGAGFHGYGLSQLRHDLAAVAGALE